MFSQDLKLKMWALESFSAYLEIQNWKYNKECLDGGGVKN